jgi:hypothetical protein
MEANKLVFITKRMAISVMLVTFTLKVGRRIERKIYNFYNHDIDFQKG